MGETVSRGIIISMSSLSLRYDRLLRVFALLIFLIVVFFFSWNSDDAYHSYIMARHLADGKGLVYNTGYRVSASTCPLLTLIEAFVFLFTNSPDVCGLLIGILFSGAAAWVLFFRLSPSPLIAFCMLGLMVSSRSFISFTTSGLENPLLFFLGALFFDFYFCDDKHLKRNLFAISLLMSFLAMTRTDSVLLFSPMAVWSYLVCTKVSLRIRVMLGGACLLPLVLWTMFSILYYGFPFPNTYYAKLHTGIPFGEYFAKGLTYFFASWRHDLMLLIVPVVSVVLLVKKRWRCAIPLAIGIAVYSLYVVSIGGDFMMGRHLTLQYFMSVCLISMLLKCDQHSCLLDANGLLRPVIGVVIFVVAIGFVWNWGTVASMCMNRVTNDVWDERAYYLSLGGEKPLYYGVWDCIIGDGRMRFRDDKRGSYILKAYAKGKKGLVFGDNPEAFHEMGFGRVLFGRDIFAAMGLNMYLTDVIALQDPLMARLSVDPPDRWIVGHVVRDIPHGYHETVASGENRIVDKSLREYYDKLVLVMKGPLFDKERLSVIVGLNCGKYDCLLREYERNRGQKKGDDSRE